MKKKDHIIMDGALQLRKMAPRSIIGFGKYYDLMVGDLLKGGYNQREYLVWVYYNAGMVSFIDSVLLDLNITDKLIIKKPGINPKMLSLWSYENEDEIDKLANHARNRKRKRLVRENSNGINRRVFSKGALQKRNHGR